MKNAIKKIVAMGTGASMLGATLMGALAADLSDYPAPFVSAGAADFMMVLGAGAAPADLLGAIDIATNLGLMG